MHFFLFEEKTKIHYVQNNEDKLSKIFFLFLFFKVRAKKRVKGALVERYVIRRADARIVHRRSDGV